MERKMPHIPNDVVVEILLRLPVKSLVQFRWTCKYWFDLITRDHVFIKKHLHHSTTIAHDDKILTISNWQNNGDYKLFQHSLDYNDTTRVGDVSSEVCIALFSDCPLGYQEILSSCNGLILIYERVNETLYIWNPCTREYKILPHPPCSEESRLSCMYRQYRHYGFGYDHTTDDYKVIRSMSHLRSDVQVYTLRTNSWRKVDGLDPRIFWCYEKTGVFVNGVLYWINFVNNDVISFDIGKEKFQDVPKIPNHSDGDVYWSNVRMRVFEGYLCVILKSKDQQNCAEMWVMKDCAMNEPSWTKFSTIPNCFPIVPVPLRFTRNGEILMVTNKKDLSLYDPKNNDVKTLCRICEYPNRRFIDVLLTESLVSLDSRTYIGSEPIEEQETTTKKITNKEHQEHEQEDVIQETTAKKSTNKEHQEHEQEDVMMMCKNHASFSQCFQFLWSCITFS